MEADHRMEDHHTEEDHLMEDIRLTEVMVIMGITITIIHIMEDIGRGSGVVLS
jgi:hypothetical protein